MKLPDNVYAANIEKARHELQRAIQIAEHNGLDVLVRVREISAVRGRLPCKEIEIITVREIEIE